MKSETNRGHSTHIEKVLHHKKAFSAYQVPNKSTYFNHMTRFLNIGDIYASIFFLLRERIYLINLARLGWSRKNDKIIFW